MISFIVFLFSFLFYYSRKDAEYIFCLIFLATSGFGFLDTANIFIKSEDLIVLSVVYVTLNEWMKDKKYFKIKSDIFGKTILLILLFLFIQYLRTILFKIETPTFALKAIRHFLVLFLYFYLRRLKFKEFSRLTNLCLSASLVQGVFFYLQLFGLGGILTGRIDEATRYGEISRYANYPLLAEFFSIYFMVNEKKNIFTRFFFIVIFIFMPVIGQARGAILRVAIAIVIFFIIKRKVKYSIYIFIGALFFQYVVNPMFEYRTRNRKENTFEEIMKVVKDPTSIYESYTSGNAGGTFAFRIAMLMERIYYISDNPQYLPIGTGIIHEDSPNNKFIFKLGTRKEQFKSGRNMIGGADITWMQIILLHGLVGVVIFMVLLFVWIKKGLPMIRKNSNPLLIASSLYSIVAFFQTFNGNYFHRIFTLLFLLVFIAVIHATSYINVENK